MELFLQSLILIRLPFSFPSRGSQNTYPNSLFQPNVEPTLLRLHLTLGFTLMKLNV